MKRRLFFAICLVCTALPASSFAVTVYDEAVSGDAKPNYLFEGPLFQLKPGANIFRGTVNAAVKATEDDYNPDTDHDHDGYFFTFPYPEELVGGKVVFSIATQAGDIGFATEVSIDRTTPNGGFLGTAYQAKARIFDNFWLSQYPPYALGSDLALSSSGSPENYGGGEYYRASVGSTYVYTNTIDVNVSASTDYELTIYLAARSAKPIVINSKGAMEFDGVFGSRGELLPLDGMTDHQNAVGEIAEVSGSVTIRRADGSVITNATIGTPVYTGDTVETGSSNSATIRFVDESEFAISQEARLTIDDYVYSPHVNNGPTPGSILKGIFKFTAGLLGDPDQDDNRTTPVGSIGIRGSLDDIEQADPVTGEPFRTAVVNEIAVFEAGSPATLYTAVQVPDAATSLSFDFAFFDDSVSSIEVMLGEVLLGVVDATSLPLGTYGRAEFAIADELYEASLFYELALTYNGETGSQAFVDNFVFGGSSTMAINNGDFSEFDNGWFARGEGKVLLGAVVVAAVPEPTSLGILAIALGCWAHSRRSAGRLVA